MVSKCANPACSATFRYMPEGRLFQVGVGSAAPEQEKVATLERFWLCGECSRRMTVVSRPDGVLVVPLQTTIGIPRKRNKSETVGFNA
jgi:hypothetical protein